MKPVMIVGEDTTTSALAEATARVLEAVSNIHGAPRLGRADHHA